MKIPYRKIGFFLFVAWWAYPIKWVGTLMGDVFHYGETDEERKQRHEFKY